MQDTQLVEAAAKERLIGIAKGWLAGRQAGRQAG